MKPINKKNPTLSDVLRYVACEIYCGRREELAEGLCGQVNTAMWCAVRGEYTVGWEAALTIESQFREALIPHLEGDVWLCEPDTRWSQRAMFALLLAEQLEQEV